MKFLSTMKLHIKKIHWMYMIKKHTFDLHELVVIYVYTVCFHTANVIWYSPGKKRRFHMLTEMRIKPGYYATHTMTWHTTWLCSFTNAAFFVSVETSSQLFILLHKYPAYLLLMDCVHTSLLLYIYVNKETYLRI